MLNLLVCAQKLQNPETLFGLIFFLERLFKFSGLFEITSENTLKKQGKSGHFQGYFSIFGLF